MGVVAAILVVAVIVLAKLMRRSMAIRRTLQLQHVRGREYRRMLHQLGFYMDRLSVLERGGLAKPPWRPPMAHAVALSAGQPAPAALVREITDAFYEVRYGGKALGEQRLEQARTCVRQLAQTLRVRM
jgi:hypothetical protein